MSLIDEALKRAQAAETSDKRPETDRHPWTSAPLPDRGRARKRTAFRALAAAAAILSLAAAAWLVLRRTPGAAPSFPAKEGRGLPFAASANEAENRSAITTPAVAGTSGAPVLLEEVDVPPPPYLVSPVPATQPSAAAAQEATVTQRPPAERHAALVNGKTYVGLVKLPGGASIELGGIVYSEANATALVNGKVVGPGAVIEGLQLQTVEENRVQFSNSEGLTIYIALR